MKMAYISDSVLYTDGINYYCKVYFCPDEIAASFNSVDTLIVFCRLYHVDNVNNLTKIHWDRCNVEFVDYYNGNRLFVKKMCSLIRTSRQVIRSSNISYLKFCFLSSYVYGMMVKKEHGNQVFVSHMVGDPDCILAFSSSPVKLLGLRICNCIQKRLYKVIASKMDLQIYVSKQLKEKYAVKNVKAVVVNENRVKKQDIVSPNSVDKKYTNPNLLRLVFVGRLSPEKRVFDILKALKQCDDVTLDIIGDGSEKEALEKYIFENSLSERVTILARKKWGDELFGEMKLHDVLVLASESEGLPLVIAEAMSCGLTVIASNVGGVPEIVRDGINGVLFEKGNIEMLTSSIEKVKNEEYRSRLIKEALKTAHEYCFERQADILRSEIIALMGK